SLAINGPADDRGRCFLAERLWLLVPEAALVQGLDDALQRIGELIRNGAHHPLLMSGPSRTADIERVLTIGVHGPRAVVIVVVGSAPYAKSPISSSSSSSRSVSGSGRPDSSSQPMVR